MNCNLNTEHIASDDMSGSLSSFRTQPTLKPSHNDVRIEIPQSNDSNRLNHKQRPSSPLPTQSLPGQVQSLSRELQENPSTSQDVPSPSDYHGNVPQSKAANKSLCFYSGVMTSGSSSDSDSSDEDTIQKFIKFNDELNEFSEMVSRLQLEDEVEPENTNYKYSWSQDYLTDTDEDCRPTQKKIKIS